MAMGFRPLPLLPTQPSDDGGDMARKIADDTRKRIAAMTSGEIAPLPLPPEIREGSGSASGVGSASGTGAATAAVTGSASGVGGASVVSAATVADSLPPAISNHTVIQSEASGGYRFSGTDAVVRVSEWPASTSAEPPIVRSPKSAKSMAVSLAFLVCDEIERRQADRPNDTSYIDFLRSVAEGLAQIADAIGDAESASDPVQKSSRFKSVSALATKLAMAMDTFLSKHDSEVQFVKNVGLWGAGTYFLCECGAPPIGSFLASGLLLGGRTARETIDAILDRWPGKSET